jgi:predicted secreted Zn-dependent protease
MAGKAQDTPPIPDAVPDSMRHAIALPRPVGRAVPLLAGFIVASVCIAVFVGWMRQQPRAEQGAETAPVTAQEQAPAQQESSWAQGAVPTSINLDLAYAETRYDVSGKTPAEILTSIDRNAPSTARGKAAGLTRMEGRSFAYVRDPATGACHITHVHALITVTLPDLASGWTMPEQVLESWSAYERSVAAHEQQHVSIYRAGAERAVRLLESRQPFADKSAMERAFEQTWSAEMASADVENEAFHRRELDDSRMEREVLTNELARVERELDDTAQRLAEIERAHPDLRLPVDEARRYNEAAGRQRGLVADRQRLAEQLAWLR